MKERIDQECEESQRAELFHGGIPTEPDVRALKEAYPESVLKVGLHIDFTRVSQIIGVPYPSCRFRTVTNAWRKEVEKEWGFVIEPPRDGTFMVLSDSGKAKSSKRKTVTAGRYTRRSFAIGQKVNMLELPSDERNEFQYTQSVNGKILAILQTRRFKKSDQPTIEDNRKGEHGK